MQSAKTANGNVSSCYINGLKIGSISFDAYVEVFKQHQINRDKPTAFIAGRGYEASLGPEPPDKVVYKAEDLGTILGKFYTVITGHCPGIPSYVAKAALENTEVIGVSPFSIAMSTWLTGGILKFTLKLTSSLSHGKAQR